MDLQLGDVQETALIPLAIRANETKRENARIHDRKAVEIIDTLGIDTKDLDKFFSHEGVVARTILFDRAVKKLQKRQAAFFKQLRLAKPNQKEGKIMSNSKNGKGLKGKDLITIGIFSAIYFVVNFAFMLMGGIHPVFWILMPGFIAVFAGIPFMLMAAKVQKPGAVFLMGLITALIYFVTGQFTLVILISMASA